MDFRVVDISEGGVQVETRLGLPPATICELKVSSFGSRIHHQGGSPSLSRPADEDRRRMQGGLPVRTRVRRIGRDRVNRIQTTDLNCCGDDPAKRDRWSQPRERWFQDRCTRCDVGTASRPPSGSIVLLSAGPPGPAVLFVGFAGETPPATSCDRNDHSRGTTLEIPLDKSCSGSTASRSALAGHSKHRVAPSVAMPASTAAPSASRPSLQISKGGSAQIKSKMWSRSSRSVDGPHRGSDHERAALPADPERFQIGGDELGRARWASTKTTLAAPRDRASIPTAPVPAKRSSTRAPVIVSPKTAKQRSRMESGVGRSF